MKKLNDSPELIIVAFGLVFASLIMLASLFYSPPLSTATVIYSNNTTSEATEADIQQTAQQSASGSYENSQVTSDENNSVNNAVETAPASGKININTADADALCTLKGIGEVKAQRIIDYRNSNGAFSSIEEIMNISGIGEKTFENIKDSITV